MISGAEAEKSRIIGLLEEKVEELPSSDDTPNPMKLAYQLVISEIRQM